MKFGVLSTDGGTHPPEKWAVLASELLFQIDEKVDGARLIQAKTLQNSIAVALLPFFSKHRDDEIAALDLDGDGQLDNDHDATDRAETAINAVVKLAKGSPWAEHWADPLVQTTARQEMAGYLATVAKEERMEYCDKAESGYSTEWKERLMGGDPAVLALVAPTASVEPQPEKA